LPRLRLVAQGVEDRSQARDECGPEDECGPKLVRAGFPERRAYKVDPVMGISPSADLLAEQAVMEVRFWKGTA